MKAAARRTPRRRLILQPEDFMRRSLSLFLLTLPLGLGGCACLTGQASYRIVPVRGLGISMPPEANLAGAALAPFAGLEPINVNDIAGEEVSAPADAQQSGYRNPEKAFCLACLVAGGGHFYTGETVKGAVLLGAAAAGLIGGAVLSSDGGDEFGDCEYNPETFECEPKGGKTPLLIGAGIAAASWIYGIVDSRPSAQRINTRNGMQVGAAAIETQPWLGLREGGFGGGLNFRVTW
jgi:hypothetical protein